MKEITVTNMTLLTHNYWATSKQDYKISFITVAMVNEPPAPGGSKVERF
jgi:hypothetical protein